MNPIQQQYQWVAQTRNVLFEYCSTMTPTDYVKQVSAFGWGSVRNLHVHVADCYRHWLQGFGLGEKVEDTPVHAYPSVDDVARLFASVDDLVQQFLAKFEHALDQPITGHVPWQRDPLQLSPLWLLTHTITHEFHHKGQLVSLTRHLGYAPPDTDLVLPDQSG
ncbi:DinB family protein [Alicyclobacillus cycloheptanicus]|uniref:Damage-inducible protein DinB n=1 Tax=Alicyclobacillus cycloheptanicus TaxID=1457 RepID=A0ABT9XFL8_9BACL|nr:DinB family protein [Alicyclobacillus cycloheptanicus]MDQ0188536.1 putative damage-inducible protein DinB [Alicyclobacillus cycloheptanicus]WDM01221.1 DinB family protein [Alicyclobacillus cycloheptanicus]